MLSDNHRLIFVHIPRTGGSSIEFAFGQNMWEFLALEKHLSAKETLKKYGKGKWETYFTFSFVRNPWERVISLWKTGYYDKSASLYEFLLQYRPAEHEFKSPFYSDILNLDLDFIGRFETLEDDFRYICKKIGVEATLPHAEKSTKEHYSYYYNNETKFLVGHLYRKDIRRFKYSFEDRHDSIKKIPLEQLSYPYCILKFRIGLLIANIKMKVSCRHKKIRV